MKRIMPLLDRVLIRRAINKPKSAGGVLLPESALKTLNQGEVIAVGAGARDEAGKIIPLCVEVGDKVLSWSDPHRLLFHTRFFCRRFSFLSTAEPASMTTTRTSSCSATATCLPSSRTERSLPKNCTSLGLGPSYCTAYVSLCACGVHSID